ncbi:MAG: hypothetical protein GY906_08620 [bacterium]|nr:hypothetical protein [bacterium]
MPENKQPDKDLMSPEERKAFDDLEIETLESLKTLQSDAGAALDKLTGGMDNYKEKALELEGRKAAALETIALMLERVWSETDSLEEKGERLAVAIEELGEKISKGESVAHKLDLISQAIEQLERNR